MLKLPNYQKGDIVRLLLSDVDCLMLVPTISILVLVSNKLFLNLLMYGQFLVYSLIIAIVYLDLKLKIEVIYKLVLSLLLLVVCLVQQRFNGFYLNEKKRVVPENIYHILAPVSLAQVIMGDGTAVSGVLEFVLILLLCKMQLD